MKELITYSALKFYKLERAREVEDLKFIGFDYFRGLGIVDYKRTFQTWLRKFPRPIIIVGVKSKRVCLWVHIDEWDEGQAKDGNPIYVLRAIESLPELRGKRMGHKLVLLGLQQTVGYLITKPINPGAMKFFKRIGFKEEKEFKRCPIDLLKHPGHFILPMTRKRELLRDFSFYFDGIPSTPSRPTKPKPPPRESGKHVRSITDMLRKEIAATRHGSIKVSSMKGRPKKLAVVYDPMHIVHTPQTPNPENPERLTQIMNHLQTHPDFFDRNVKLISPVNPAPIESVLRVHTREYIDFIHSLCRRGGGFIGDSTYLTPSSFSVALQAVGGALRAGDLVIEGQFDFAFALIRPPGHHATKDQYGGYCIFNNAAILARKLQAVNNKQRIMIVDWDAHAANGTMDLFYDDPSVLLVSMHQNPHKQYPRTGFKNQLGKGDGLGYTVNVEMPEGAGDVEYKMVLGRIVEPLAKVYRPDFVIACCGFDLHHSERNTDLQTTSVGIFAMFEAMRKLAAGRLAIILEGGYNPHLGELVYAGCQALLGNPNPFKEKNDVLSTSALKRIKTHRIMEERLDELLLQLREYHEL